MDAGAAAGGRGSGRRRGGVNAIGGDTGEGLVRVLFGRWEVSPSRRWWRRPRPWPMLQYRGGDWGQRGGARSSLLMIYVPPHL